MNGAIDGSGEHGRVRQGEGVETQVPPKWGLRTPYRMLAMVVHQLDERGPSSAEEIAHYLVAESPAASQPNARRGSGLSSANQSIVTLRNLGLVERAGGKAVLSAKGKGFARALGSPEEQRAFRDLVLEEPGFAWFWEHVSEGAKTVARFELLPLAARLYGGVYNEETRRTLVGIFVNYARFAGLLKEGPGGHRYAVARTARPAMQATPIKPPPSIVASRVYPGRPPATRLEHGHEPLHEASRLLGWVLADSSLLRDSALRARVSKSFMDALSPRVGDPMAHYVRLASEQADSAFAKQDLTLVGWTVRLVNLLVSASHNNDATPTPSS